jgi:hypothetical protein
MLRKAVLAVLLLSAWSAAQPAPCSVDLPPQRKVAENVIDALHTPVETIEVDSAFKYVGAERFILYNIADAELHLFVDADKDGLVHRLYWVQFEGYLPNDPQRHHNYTSPKRVQMAGLQFVVDVGTDKYTEPPNPGSDGERMRKMLAAKGYKLPAEVASVRLVHLPDADQRNELMFIYAEDLAPSGYHADDLEPKGAHADKWEAFSDALLKRGLPGLLIRR